METGAYGVDLVPVARNVVVELNHEQELATTLHHKMEGKIVKDQAPKNELVTNRAVSDPNMSWEIHRSCNLP